MLSVHSNHQAGHLIFFAKNLTPAQRAHLADELADTYIYLKKIGDHFGIDLVEASLAKMKKNELKYPAALNRGRIHKR